MPRRLRSRLPHLALGALVATLVLGMTTATAAVFVPDVPEASWRVNGNVYAVAAVGDRVYVGGAFTSAVSPSGQTVARQNLAAFSADTGELITTWRSDASGQVRALESDGSSLWVGGSFTRIGGVTRNRLAKVSLDTGATDTTFNASADNQVRALDLSGGDLYVGGSFLAMNGATATRIAKVSATTGASAAGFAAIATDVVHGIVKNPVSNVVYVAGNFAGLSGQSRNGVGAISSTTGASTGLVLANAARPTLGLDISPDGTRLFGAGGSGTNSAVAWNTTTGARVWRQVTNGDIQAIRYFNDTVYFGFHDGFQGDTTLKLLAVDAASGLVDQSWEPTFDRFWGIYAIDVNAKGVYGGGDFTNVSGVRAQGWVRFHNDGGPPPEPPTTVRYLGSQSVWRYWDAGTRPAGWETTGFDASAWASGAPQLGYGDGDETTVISFGPSSTSRYVTSYYRTTFGVDEIPETLQLGLLADDGAAVYLNGVEVARDNLPTGTLTNTTRASTGRSGGDENAIRPFTLPTSGLVQGTNTIAVELHQDTTTSSDAGFDADLTGQLAGGTDPDPGTPVTSTLVADSATWQWNHATAAPGSGWSAEGFDASTWNTGTAPLGWGSASIVTNIDQAPTNTNDRPRTAYFRRTFDLADRDKVTRLALRTFADDGVVLYVNGQEVTRRNITGTPSHTSYASAAPRTTAALANPLTVDVPLNLLVSGTNVIAAETHVNFRGTPDLSFQLRADVTTVP